MLKIFEFRDNQKTERLFTVSKISYLLAVFHFRLQKYCARVTVGELTDHWIERSGIMENSQAPSFSNAENSINYDSLASLVQIH